MGMTLVGRGGLFFTVFCPPHIRRRAVFYCVLPPPTFGVVLYLFCVLPPPFGGVLCFTVSPPLLVAGGFGRKTVKCDKKTKYPAGGFTNHGLFAILPEETDL